MSLDRDAVWLITGCSSGIGRELAREVLGRGWQAAVTARNLAQAADVISGFEDRSIAIGLDVTDARQCERAVSAAEDRFGHLDVLVNNAGLGYFSSAEEAELDAIQQLFEANFFGPARLIQLSLPGMRSRRSGRIVNIGSISGYVTRPALAYYAATKHAIEGLSKTLVQEVGPLGIDVVCVEPGGFRTEFSNRPLNGKTTEITDYQPTVGETMSALLSGRRNQPGDPVRAAKIIVDAVAGDRPPRHLVLGAQAYDGIQALLADLNEEMVAWRDVSLSADFPAL